MPVYSEKYLTAGAPNPRNQERTFYIKKLISAPRAEVPVMSR